MIEVGSGEGKAVCVAEGGDCEWQSAGVHLREGESTYDTDVFFLIVFMWITYG